MKPFLFSGIQPSGEIHIGNYCGAIKNWVSLLDTYDCIFCIVDYHALTQPYDRDLMAKRTFDAALVNMAAGLDPEKCRLFVQCHVPQHTELAWVLSTVTPMGDLSRMTQFKEKAQRAESESFINAGLFTYPVLQAADILLYKAVAVPVGEDQIQHIELTREVARKFNARFGEVFPEPAQLVPRDGGRILGLDGKAKMSKSLNNYIGLLEDVEERVAEAGASGHRPGAHSAHGPGQPRHLQHLHAAPQLLARRHAGLGGRRLSDGWHRLHRLQEGAAHPHDGDARADPGAGGRAESPAEGRRGGARPVRGRVPDDRREDDGRGA